MRLMAGMIGAVNYGTGRMAYNPLGQVAGRLEPAQIAISWVCSLHFPVSIIRESW
jgi:hypothetical protein